MTALEYGREVLAKWLHSYISLLGPYHQHEIGTFDTCSRVPTPRSLIDTGEGNHIENLGIATTLSLPFPSECSTDPPSWPRLVSILSNTKHTIQGSSLKGHMSATWSSDHSTTYRNLHLYLAIASGLSLAIGSTSVDWKVSLTQLQHQFNSYNLMHKKNHKVR
jgi:hypothetical protein